MAGGNPNPSPATRFSKDRQPENKRRPDPLLAALKGKMTSEKAEALAEVILQKALSGDLAAAQMVWDRLEGKAIGRQEQGSPGDFTGLEDKPIAELIDLAQRRA